MDSINRRVLLPPELVVQIVDEVLETEPRHREQDRPGGNGKAPWALVDSLTQTSKDFRDLTLSRWFRTLYLCSSSDTENIDRHFPLLKSWCRAIHCVQTQDSSMTVPWDLAGFEQLSSLRVDWLSRGKVSSPIFVNVQSKIKQLDIFGLRNPSPMLINALTFPFVDLITLRLDCMKIWCSLCNTTNLVRFPAQDPDGSPTSFIYEGGLGLPYIYARYLLQLENLEEVFIRLPDIGPRFVTPGLSAQANDNIWTGECDQCMRWLYPDEEFRRKWVNKKKGILPPSLDPENERRSVYQRPPRLRRVYWSFWKLDPAMKDGTFSQDDIDSDEDEEDPGSDDE